MSRLVLVLAALLLSGSVYGKATQSPLILLSIDGFAYDYLHKFKPKNLSAFVKSGVAAKLLPVYPSKTFPNHLSIITGVYPNKHGIIHNKFYHPDLAEFYSMGAGKKNSAWLTAKPFWSYVEENNLRSAVYFWPESEAKSQSHQPTFNIPYNNIDSAELKFNQIIKWLKLPQAQAPKFVVSYFSTIDEIGHEYGINSPELAQAIAKFDQLFGFFIKRLQQEVAEQVNIILVSDHGMMQIEKNIAVSTIFNDDIAAFIDDKAITVAQSSTQLLVYFDDKKLTKSQQIKIIQSVKAKQQQNASLFTVYQKNNYPSHWQFNNKLTITPNFIVEAAPSVIFSENRADSNRATHGYDAKNQAQLSAIFLASGPDIIPGRVVEPIENIHIVPLMAKLLGLKPLANIDGKIEKLAPVVKTP
ncbi:ectonucleotide pyrophosphatase/phosphodiesterase [Colwellia sp. KU-HH00111]|uniref:alkaline phosphatase family protein n=1 Tax=Colwellia sp. KU-HH00111 TaxID=3127652 RepID=UPI003102E091